jgi:hypothetical protein
MTSKVLPSTDFTHSLLMKLSRISAYSQGMQASENRRIHAERLTGQWAGRTRPSEGS